VLDEHNIESDYVEAKLRARHDNLSMMQRREVDALKRWEKRLWQAASEVVCVSEEDAEHVKAVRERPALVIPNGVAVDEVNFKLPSERPGFDILFIGLMGHPSNVRAARWLALDILPLVLKKEPRARLVLCGSTPSREILALRSEKIDVTGRVPDVSPYLDQAAVYANAVGHGAGTSLKVLEALASGIPLVSTRLGVRGYPLEAPRHYLHAEDANTFAERLVECLRDRNARDQAARDGREFAERYGWSDIAKKFVAVVDNVLKGNVAK
jgi:glycosyltransferase involved in cell wall biosynthesis